MAEIITLDEFIGGITDANAIITDKSILEPKSIDDFASELISLLGAKKSKYVASARGAGGWSRGVRPNDLEKILEVIPSELRNSYTVAIVNWDLFLKSAETSGIKIENNVKEYIAPAYLIKGKIISDDIATDYVESYKGSAEDLEATRIAYDTVWSQEPFNGNLFAGASISDMNNGNTAFATYYENVTQKLRDYEINRQNPDSVTSTTIPTTTQTDVPITTVAPNGSQPPSTYISSTGNTGASGNVIIPGSTGTENFTATSQLTTQEYLWQNPEATYLDLMKVYKSAPGATKFGKRYGYADSAAGEWTPQQFYDFPIKLKSSNDLIKLQDDLRKAGYFAFTGGTLPQKGVADDITRAAWGYFLKSAALAGKQPVDFLVEKIQGVAELQWDQQIIGRDPATIQSRANELGGAILGRSLNAAEITTLEEVINGWKKDELQEGNYADEPMQFDLNARMEQYLQNTYSDEAIWGNYTNSRASLQRFWG
tara:strand:+ start:1805 stop:3256 length:1452 start_codon:yes stop_codon:yes gene_type:complete